MELEEVIERLERDAKKPLACKEITLCNVDDLTRIIKYIKEESIPIAVVEEKIEEITSNIPYLATFDDWKQEQHTNAEIIENCINVLQELLKENK